MRSIPCSVTSSSSKSRRRTVERKSREGSRSRNVCQEPADGIINAKLPRFPVQRAQLYFFPASSSSTRPVKNVENIRGKVVAPISTGVHFFFLFVFSDWAEEAVAKAEILRLIYQGRFLHSNVTLGALGLPFGKTTVMHLVPRENLPEPNSQGKSSNSRYRVYPFGGGRRGGGDKRCSPPKGKKKSLCAISQDWARFNPQTVNSLERIYYSSSRSFQSSIRGLLGKLSDFSNYGFSHLRYFIIYYII